MTTKESEEFYDPFDIASKKVEEPKVSSNDFDYDIINNGFIGSDGAASKEEKEKAIDPFASGAKLAKEFHKNMKVQKVRIADSERREMESKYNISLVNDFDDDYALTDEEMHRRSKYWDLYKKVSGARKNLRSMSDYIRVCRDAMAFLKAVAGDNILYDPDEFVEKVLDGSITVVGFEIPRYKGKNKGNIDWAVVSRYIANPELNANDVDIFDKYSEMTSDGDIEITQEDYRNIMRIAVRDCPELIETVKQKGNKKKIRLGKSGQFQEISEFMSAVTKKEKQISKISDLNTSRGIRDYIDDDIAKLTKSAKKKLVEYERPKFTGDVMSDEDFDNYVSEISIWEDDNEWVRVDGRSLRKGDANIYEIKNIFEELGYSVSNMYQESITEKRDKYLANSKKSINIDKIKLDASKKELQMILDKYESEEVMRMSSERTWQEYKKKKKEIKKLEESIASREKIRLRRENMSDKEFAEDVERETKRSLKHEKKKEKKKKKQESSEYKSIESMGGMPW